MTPAAGNTPASGCTGDCDADGVVTVAEIVRLVGAALDARTLTGCTAVRGGGVIEIDDLIAAVAALLNGCDAHGSLN